MDPTARFEALIASGEWPLDLLAALVAAHARPVDPDVLVGRLDQVASTVARSIGHRASEGSSLAAASLMAALFGHGPFRGNTEDYYDPDNSYLDQVLGRGLGIPLTLSLLAVEVGRRLDVELLMIGMPGHVLVRERRDAGAFYDPFGGGGRLGLSAVEAQFHELHGDQVMFAPYMVRPTPAPQVLARMLANLHAAHARRGEEGPLGWIGHLQSLVSAVLREVPGSN